jgi:hypothetical protein
MDHEKRHGRDTTWTLRAREAPEPIKENWPDSSWIVEVVTTVISKGKRTERTHYFLTSLRTAPKALLRLVRQRWSIENEWHWVHDVQLGEDAHRDAHWVGAPLFSFMRTVVINLLRRAGFRSIHAGQQELAHDISRMLMLGGVSTASSDFQAALGWGWSEVRSAVPPASGRGLRWRRHRPDGTPRSPLSDPPL